MTNTLRVGPGLPDVESLAATPGFADLESLTLDGVMDLWDGTGDSPALDPGAIRALFRASMPRLLTLRLPLQGLTEAGARALVDAELPELRHLDLRGNDLGDAGARVIIEGFPWLATLDLRHNGLTEAEKDALLEITSGMILV